jgi:hypothetical protein
VAVTGKFSHVETIMVASLLEGGGEEWFSGFLVRAHQAYKDYSGGEINPGWYWVRYQGLHSNKDVPAEWDGHHWSSTAFAGLPRNSVEVLGPISPRLPSKLRFITEGLR